MANQYNLKKGKELFEKHADEAEMNELSEIDGLESYEPQRIEDLTYEDKNGHSNRYYLFLEKRVDQDGHKNIKGQHMAVGSKQRAYDRYEKSNGSSPTVITNSIFFSQVSLMPTKFSCYYVAR